MRPPRLRCDDLVLVAATVDDASDSAAAQDEECARWFDWPRRPTEEQCRAYLIQVSTDPDPDNYSWAMRAREVFARGIDLKLNGGAWNVSNFVSPHQRSQGIARRALRLVVDWGFACLGLSEISTRVHVENVASQKMLEATGFIKAHLEHNAEAAHADFVYLLRCPG